MVSTVVANYRKTKNTKRKSIGEKYCPKKFTIKQKKHFAIGLIFVPNDNFSISRDKFVPEICNPSGTIEIRFDLAVKYNRIMTERGTIFFINKFGIEVLL